MFKRQVTILPVITSTISSGSSSVGEELIYSYTPSSDGSPVPDATPVVVVVSSTSGKFSFTTVPGYIISSIMSNPTPSPTTSSIVTTSSVTTPIGSTLQSTSTLGSSSPTIHSSTSSSSPSTNSAALHASSAKQTTFPHSRAAAGLAIGCLIVGALIAALACILFFARRNKREAAHNGQYEPASHADEADLKHPTVVTTAAIAAGSSALIVEHNLPQPKEDNLIIGELSKIKNKIDGHIQTFYQTAGTNNQALAQALTQALGTSSPIPITKLPELLSNPRKRPNILRAAIAWIIVSRIGLESDPSETFLPAHLASTLHNLPQSRMDEPTRHAFLSKWRVITAALTGNAFTQEEMAANDPRLDNIGSALQLADSFLRTCANTADHDVRLSNLEAIMKRAARFGFLLFSQPSSFRYDWADNGVGLVVFPGLLQVSDENGKAVAPRAFGQKEIVPL